MKHPLFHRSKRRGENEFEELKRIVARLKACGPRTRAALGAGVQLANSNFLHRFTGIDSFRQSPTSEQERFWSELGELELGLRSQEVGLAVAVGLYRIWLADALAGQRDMVDLLGEELTELSRKS